MTLGEPETRRRLIRKALEQAGWSPIVYYRENLDKPIVAVEEYPTDTGPADYVLFHRDEALAIVEAKRLSRGPQSTIEQAKRYARGFKESRFDYRGYGVPFVYSTNGEVTYFQDLRNRFNLPRKISHFHTPSALRSFLIQDTSKAIGWLKTTSTEGYGLRPYQKEAIEHIESALIDGKRRMMIAMATGTGKTYIAVCQIYRLIKSGFAKKVLFLVDRRALAAQAVGAFSTFEPEPGLKFDSIYNVYSQRFHKEDLEDFKFQVKAIPQEDLLNPNPHHTFVFVCTIQLMRSMLFGREEVEPITGDEEYEAEVERIDIPIHAFDVIIADECHRGYTATEEGKWREVLDHFDAIKIGLTATPALHTKAYFKDIIFEYGIDRAIQEGWLVDYDIVRIHSGIRMEGMFLKRGEHVELIDTQTGKSRYDVLEDEREFDSTRIEKDITAPDMNKKIVVEFAKYALKQEEESGRFPKTLVFAVNDLEHISHADRLVNILREQLGRGSDFVTKITGKSDRPLRLFRKFRNRREPGISVTVDMLTTGVDVPRLENLLFLRPVKSRILFEQMLGRGTRKCEDIKKTHFTIFDSVGVLDYFRYASPFVSEPPDKPYRTTRQIIKALYNNEDREHNTKILVRRLQRIHKNITAEGRKQFLRFTPDRDIGEFASNLPQLLEKEWKKTMQILTNKQFLWLVENYPRSRTFIKALDQEDMVESEFLFKTIDGKSLRPSEYIKEFQQYIKTNPDHIEALEILLKRPKDFDTEALKELRDRLAHYSHRFTESNLRRAYKFALADIISIVKHAVDDIPLITAEERIDIALKRVTKGQEFKPEQEEWLELIRSHLIENIIIEKGDFNMIPFSRRGGWRRANRVFEGRLLELLVKINEGMLE